MSYDAGYEDGFHREKGRSYDYSLHGEDAREYRRGYFQGYPDGRADNDPDDEYLYGRNGAEYYDMKDDDDWNRITTTIGTRTMKTTGTKTMMTTGNLCKLSRRD